MAAPYYEADGITLHHGDALDILPAIPAAGCIIIDPPYSMTPNAVRGRDDGAAGTSATPVRLVAETFRHVYRLLPDGGCAFVFCDWRRGPDTTYLAVLAGLRVSTCIAWTRNRPGTGGMFRSAWDPIYVVSKGSPDALDRAAIPNVIRAEYPSKRSHPYEKPAAVWDHLLARIPPTTVVDPFAGSCGSADAALRHGHRWVGIEVDAMHIRAAITRWESMLPAVLPAAAEADGPPFISDGFCPLCAVSLDLHPYGEIDVHEPDPWECEVAARKADVIAQFGGIA